MGASCTNGGDCASGYCATGTCCDSACDRVCEQCSATGSCQLLGDDPRCGTIECPQDAACVDFATSLTTNRCATRGTCKTMQDCPSVDLSTATYCGGPSSAPLFCDGKGSCDQPPRVICGGDPSCPGARGACCFDSSSGTARTECVGDATTCRPSDTSHPCFATAIACDKPKGLSYRTNTLLLLRLGMEYRHRGMRSLGSVQLGNVVAGLPSAGLRHRFGLFRRYDVSASQLV